MESFTEDQPAISPELWRVWEARTRVGDKAHARNITIVLSGALLVLWLAGMITRCRLGGSIHILLLAAVAVLVMQVLWDRRSIL